MKHFDYDPTLFSLDDTVACGQVFRWKRNENGSWSGVVRNRLLTLTRDGNHVYYEACPDHGDELELLRDLFLLDSDLEGIKRELVERDPSLAGPLDRTPGLRLMRQDPEECLLSFICSTANNVPRIAHGIRQMSRLLGEEIALSSEDIHYSFPTLVALANADPTVVQPETGLGYRAASLVRVANQLLSREQGWLIGLRQRPYAEAHAALLELKGVGPKIADCVCLFSLDHTEAVPVDTHIWQVAQELWYAPVAGGESGTAPDTESGAGAAGKKAGGTSKGLTSTGYKRVGDEFRSRYGLLAGYAQNWLFYNHFRGYWGGTSPLLKSQST